MIEAEFIIKKNRKPVGLIVKGHSGLSEKGTDILCAAVSVLSENLGESVQRLLGIRADVRKSSGYYKIKIQESEADNQTELLFSSVLLGLQVLAGQYPGRIQINFTEE